MQLQRLEQPRYVVETGRQERQHRRQRPLPRPLGSMDPRIRPQPISTPP